MRTKVTLILLALLLPLSLNAEPASARGKLPDGRAFRTDVEGNQIVDYIAELEVAIEGLNRRIYSLEDEIKDKDFEIERLAGGGTAAGEITEKEINGKGPAASEAACARYISKARLAAEQDLNSFKDDAEVERQLSERCTSELSEAKNRLDSALSALEEKSRETYTLKDALNNSEQQVASLQGEIRNAQEGRAAASRERDEQLTRAAQLAKQREEELKKIEDMKKEKDTRLASQLETLRREREEFRAKQNLTVAYQSQNLDAARMKAVESVRDRVGSDLNQVKSLALTRDEIYAGFKKKKHSLAFTPFKPVSETGKSLSDLASDLKSAKTVSEVATTGRQIAWIQSRIQDDISLMQRIEKIAE